MKYYDISYKQRSSPFGVGPCLTIKKLKSICLKFVYLSSELAFVGLGYLLFISKLLKVVKICSKRFLRFA